MQRYENETNVKDEATERILLCRDVQEEDEKVDFFGEALPPFETHQILLQLLLQALIHVKSIMDYSHNIAIKVTNKLLGVGFDVTGGKIEYNILDPLGPGTNHTMVAEYPFDHQCPQNNTMHIVRCTAHQHIGARCMHAYNAETGEQICSSCPIYGQVKGVSISYRMCSFMMLLSAHSCHSSTSSN